MQTRVVGRLAIEVALVAVMRVAAVVTVTPVLVLLPVAATELIVMAVIAVTRSAVIVVARVRRIVAARVRGDAQTFIPMRDVRVSALTDIAVSQVFDGAEAYALCGNGESSLLPRLRLALKNALSVSQYVGVQRRRWSVLVTRLTLDRVDAVIELLVAGLGICCQLVKLGVELSELVIQMRDCNSDLVDRGLDCCNIASNVADVH